MKRTITGALAAVFVTATVAAAIPAGLHRPGATPTRPAQRQYAIVGGSDEFYVTATSNCATDGCTASLVSNRGWTAWPP